MRRLLGLASLVAVVWLGQQPVLAQASGTITGVVTDPSGAVVPGVTIEAINLSTNRPQSAVTGSDGHYSVVLLQPGRYRVTGTLAGFKTFVRDDVTVTVESSARVDMQMAVGAIEESVRVTTSVPLVETRSATLGIVVNERQIVELPLNGRNFSQLGTLLPGVVAPPTALGGASGDATAALGFGAATAGFSVNGMRNQSNNFLLDGASNNDTFNTGFVLRPPPDAIQEFKILTHSYAAEYGRSAGSVVNVVTRSGSNDFHGAAWEFNRDDALQARNSFAPADQPRPNLKQNQFGVTLGGPLKRNRLFGFGYYEGYRNTNGNTQNIVVLTDAQREGRFGSTEIRDPLTGRPFENNTIPRERLDPTALRLLEDFVPRANSGTNRYVVSPDTVDNRDQFGARLDYQLSESNTVLGRYLRSHTKTVAPPTTRPVDSVSEATLEDVMVSDRHIFGASAINVARLSYNKIGSQPAKTSGLTNADYGINVPHNVPAAQGLANIAVTGFFNGLGDAAQPFVERSSDVWEFSNELTWVHGLHNMKFGADIRREHMVIGFINRPNGDFEFGGTFTGNSAADFLLGLPTLFRRTTTNTVQDGSGWLHAGYAQDEFRPVGNVTLSLGLRYELAIPFEDVNGALNAFHPGVQSVRFPDAPAGLVYPGDPGVPDGTYKTDTNNLAPRVGVVWDPTGSGRTSLRAAWGIFYDAIAGQGDFFQNGVLAPPFTPLLEVNAPPAALTLRDPLRDVTGGAPGFPPGLTFIGWGEDFSSPYAHHFNVTWQQELKGAVATEVAYVGSRARNLPIFMEINPGLYAPGQTTRGARLYPAFALARPTFSVAKSWFNSFQASLRMRPSNGMNFLASYTLGHAVDHISGLNIGGEQRPVLPVIIGDDESIDRALALETGDALFDVRHRFVISFGVDLPTPHSLGQPVALALGGWQLTGIVQAQTGFPFSVIDTVTDIRYLTNRPNMVCDPNESAPHTAEQWFNTACFARRALPETALPGDQLRNSVRGPGFAKTDLSLTKAIAINEQHRLQLRMEVFNLFNQTQFRNPGNTIATANFGRITAAEDGRIVQLAAKYTF